MNTIPVTNAMKKQLTTYMPFGQKRNGIQKQFYAALVKQSSRLTNTSIQTIIVPIAMQRSIQTAASIIICILKNKKPGRSQ